MKRALINSLEPGRVCEVVDIGKEFEVADTFSWVDCPDDTTTTHTFLEDGTFEPFNILNLPGFVENGYKVARMIAYGSIGDQLDMIYKEILTNGSITANSSWVQHITSVKNTIPKDDPEAVLEWNRQQNF